MIEVILKMFECTNIFFVTIHEINISAIIFAQSNHSISQIMTLEIDEKLGK